MTIVFDDSGNGGSAVSHWRGFAHIGLDLRAKRVRERKSEGKGRERWRETDSQTEGAGREEEDEREREGKKQTGPERMRAT